MNLFKTMNEKLSEFLGRNGSSGVSAGIFSSPMQDLLKPIRQYANQSRSRLRSIDAFSTALLSVENLVLLDSANIGEDFNDIGDIRELDINGETTKYVKIENLSSESTADNVIIGPVANSVISALQSAVLSAPDEEKDSTTHADGFLTFTFTSAKGYAYRILVTDSNDISPDTPISVVSWFETESGMRYPFIVIRYIDENDRAVWMRANPIPMNFVDGSSMKLENMKALCINTIDNATIVETLRDACDAICRNRLADYLQIWKDKFTVGYTSLKDSTSRQINIAKRVLVGLNSAYVAGGIKGAISYIYKYIESPTHLEQDEDGLMKFTDNSRFRPTEYIAGIIVKLISLAVEVVAAIIAIFNQAIGMIVGIVGGFLWGIVGSFKADLDSTRVAIYNPSDFLSSVEVLDCFPLAQFSGQFQLLSDSWYYEWRTAEGCDCGCISVVGGYIFFGPGKIIDNRITELRWEFHAAAYLWTTPWTYPDLWKVTEEIPSSAFLRYQDGISFENVLPASWDIHKDDDGQPWSGVDIQPGVRPKTLKRMVASDLTIEKIENQWKHMTSDVSKIRPLNNKSSGALSPHDDKALFDCYTACCGLFLMWCNARSIASTAIEYNTSILGPCLSGFYIETNVTNSYPYTRLLPFPMDKGYENFEEKFNYFFTAVTALCVAIRPLNSTASGQVGYNWEDSHDYLTSSWTTLIELATELQNRSTVEWKLSLFKTSSPLTNWDAGLERKDTLFLNLLFNYRGMFESSAFYDVPIALNLDFKYLTILPKYNGDTFLKWIGIATLVAIGATVLITAATVGFKMFQKKKIAKNIAAFNSKQAEYQDAVSGVKQVYNPEKKQYDVIEFDVNSAEGKAYIKQCWKAYKFQAFKNNAWSHIIGGSRYDVTSFWGEAEVDEDESSIDESINDYLPAMEDIDAELPPDEQDLTYENDTTDFPTNVGLDQIVKLLNHSYFEPSE